MESRSDVLALFRTWSNIYFDHFRHLKAAFPVHSSLFRARCNGIARDAKAHERHFGDR